MKKITFIFVLVSIFCLSATCFAQVAKSSPTIEEVKEETREFLQVVGAFSYDKMAEGVEKVKAGLDKLDERMDELEVKFDEKWDEMSEERRKQAREIRKELRRHRNKVSEWYGSMKASSPDAWDHMKKGFSDAYEDLEAAWHKSEEEFNSSE